MPTISSLRERRDRCTFAWGASDTIELEYQAIPAADLGQGDIDALVERARGKPVEDQRRALAGFLVPLLTSWNVYEWEKRGEDGSLVEHGPMIPVSVEAMLAFDDRFIGACAAAILEHVHTGKVNGLPLSGPGTATTSPTAGDASSPAGRANRASRRNANSRKSRSSAASRRGSSPSTPSGSPSSPRE